MPMTIDQQIAFFEERAEQCLMYSKEAYANRNYSHYASLISHIFEEYLMKGLIYWRMDIAPPVEILKNGLGIAREGYTKLSNINCPGSVYDINNQKISYVSFLLNDKYYEYDFRAFEEQYLLDAILNIGLRDNWDDVLWAKGMSGLTNRDDTSLVIETYSTYRQLLFDKSRTSELVEYALNLFNRRKDDDYFMGCIQSDGGDFDNDVTVDYRLAAILKKIGYTKDNIHLWRWG
jgi:hypothetical protein